MCPNGFEEPHDKGYSARAAFGRALTQREYEILVEYAKHGNYKQVGHCLGISEQTTKNHLAAVRDKLGVHTTVQAYQVIGWLKVPGMGTGGDISFFQSIRSHAASLSKTEKKQVIELMVEIL